MSAALIRSGTCHRNSVPLAWESRAWLAPTEGTWNESNVSAVTWNAGIDWLATLPPRAGEVPALSRL